MRLLLIDHLSPEGHKKFDEIHISALHDLGHEVTLIGRNGHFPSFENMDDIRIVTFPEWSFRPLPLKPLSERLFGIFRLLWLLFHVKFKDYDAVVLLSYDVLSLFMFRIRKDVFLINHNNVSQINNSKIKLLLTRTLPNNYKHVALNEMMEKRLKELLPYKTIVYVPHGIFLQNGDSSKPDFIDEGKKFLFCPVNRNYDAEFVKKLLGSTIITDYLEKNNLVLYVKKSIELSRNSNSIRHITTFLTDKEYEYMIEKAQAVILPYSDGFKYRCSGILFECIARNTYVISTRIPDMEIYRDKAKISFFSSDKEFVECLMGNDVKLISNSSVFDVRQYWKKILG